MNRKEEDHFMNIFILDQDPVLSYRLYYVCCKLKICKWKYPAVEPFWVRELVNNLTHFL